jgi:hypothetical protein
MTPRPVEEENMEEAETGVEQSTPEEGSPTTSTKVGVGGYELSIDNSALPYFGVVLTATVLLISVLVGDFDKNEEYGIAAACINMVFGLFGAYMSTKNRDRYEKTLGTLPYFGAQTWGSGLALFLFMWSFIAAGILTFNGPFKTTSNGYFAAWGMVLFALMAMGLTTEALSNQAGSLGYYTALVVASIIQLCAIIPEMKNKDGEGQIIYSLVLCILTIVVVLAFGAYSNADKAKFPAFAVFAIMWIVMACFVTFDGPFIETGNGYFSAWMGCGLTVMIAASLVPK